MTLKVTFELSATDLRHFRTIMREVRAAARHRSDDEIISSAERLLHAMADVAVPDFVAERLDKLRTLIDMLRDDEWQIPARERNRVLNATAYFAETHDLIPDHIPGLGFLDDAIMIELVVHGLRHETEAYRDFCAFRDELEQRRAQVNDSTPERARRLAGRRKSLHERMRRRDSRRRKGGTGASVF